MNLQCFLMVRCTASEWNQWRQRIFLYIYYIYIYIYMNISSSSRDRQCWGSISKPQTADFFFLLAPFLFLGFFFYIFPQKTSTIVFAHPLIFLCYNTKILYNFPEDQVLAEDRMLMDSDGHSIEKIYRQSQKRIWGILILLSFFFYANVL